MSENRKRKEYNFSPICGRCRDLSPREFIRLHDGIFVKPCSKCGNGSVVITVKAWKNMRRKRKDGE